MAVNTNFVDMNDEFYRDGIFYLLIFGVFAVVVLIIFITNRLLTRMVFKNIIMPLDLLAYGVHQIRDGNLEYRIVYKSTDEFAAICNDFNEMADRLLDMVNAWQKDEANRKELIAGISHDLCTPLTSIKTYVEGIELGMASTPQKLNHYLDTIKGKTNELDHIINQLFLFSKLDVGEFPMPTEKIDIGEWLSGYIEAVSEEYEQKGLNISLVENTQSTIVCVDSVQLRSVLSNVLENSVKYGKNEQGAMHIACVLNSPNVTISMSDNGPGVPTENLDKLFQIFYRGDKARTNTSQGSGLGLAISAKIIERLNGTTRAVNSSTGGLSVIITLPVQGGHEK